MGIFSDISQWNLVNTKQYQLNNMWEFHYFDQKIDL